LDRSTESSGAVIRSSSWPVLVWKDVCTVLVPIQYRFASKVYLVKQLDQVDIVSLITEMQLQQLIYRRFEQDCVVDRDRTDTWDAIIARLPPAREGFVHEVVHYEEKRL
jgi:hypothetical protein